MRESFLTWVSFWANLETIDSHWVNSCFSDASSGILDLNIDGVSVIFAVHLLGFFSSLEDTENKSRCYCPKMIVFCAVGLGRDSRALFGLASLLVPLSST